MSVLLYFKDMYDNWGLSLYTTCLYRVAKLEKNNIGYYIVFKDDRLEQMVHWAFLNGYLVNSVYNVRFGHRDSAEKAAMYLNGGNSAVYND